MVQDSRSASYPGAAIASSYDFGSIDFFSMHGRAELHALQPVGDGHEIHGRQLPPCGCATGAGGNDHRCRIGLRQGGRPPAAHPRRLLRPRGLRCPLPAGACGGSRCTTAQQPDQNAWARTSLELARARAGGPRESRSRVCSAPCSRPRVVGTQTAACCCLATPVGASAASASKEPSACSNETVLWVST
jgi:hypothetical protein